MGESCLHDARKRMQLFWKAHSKKRKFEDDDFKDIALNLIHPNPAKRMDIEQIVKHRWFAKGPYYNRDELKLYLTKRVKAVLQGRARKIRKLMQEQQTRKGPKGGKVRDPLGSASDLERRIKEIDPQKEFDRNIQNIQDCIFPHSLFQFFTYKSPQEMAVRIESAATKNQMKIQMVPSENLITMECGFIAKDILMVDGTNKAPTEIVTFCAKQFAVDDISNNDKPLFQRDDIKYLVSFKRLQGTFAAYSKIMTMFVNHEDIRICIDWTDVDNLEQDDDHNNDDDQKSNEKQ